MDQLTLIDICAFVFGVAVICFSSCRSETFGWQAFLAAANFAVCRIATGAASDCTALAWFFLLGTGIAFVLRGNSIEADMARQI